ncbi:MAG: threonylcarbamoyl-AMP synthase [Actinomycetales bacterium]|nr:threonylcarbamoyl-AMP synthase [Actinomycetales bacterium]
MHSVRHDLIAEFDTAKDAAVSALQSGELVVLPTDTVYGIAADAFSPQAVERLLAAKGRTRAMPPPVLIYDTSVLDALVVDIPNWARTMFDELWPGALTVICRAQQSLTWDLGDTRGTIAVRVPAHAQVLELLKATGPLAVSSANLTGQSAATTIDEAETMLGESVSVYLDGGPAGAGVASTILDMTSIVPRVVRLGGVSLEELHRFNNTIEMSAG